VVSEPDRPEPGVAISTSRLERARVAARHHYYRSLAPRRGTRRRTAAEPLLDLDRWLDGLGRPERIVVVAGGPTASDLAPQPGDLHVATNSSEAVVREHPYVYFLTEGFHVQRYLKRGPASAQCRGTFFRMSAQGLPEVQAEISRRARDHVRTYVRAVPEIVASDLEATGVERETYDAVNRLILERLGEELRQYNSGFGATYLGYVLATTFEVPLHLYGLDAGVGGHQHFDGSPMQSPSVVGDRVQGKLTHLLRQLDRQRFVEVVNHSAFRPVLDDPPAEGPSTSA
jgi:hypothetical protein